MREKMPPDVKFRLSTLPAAVLMALPLFAMSPVDVKAAGLGKVAVFSALGQPFRAEVELSATSEELLSMKPGLASPESFKAVGLEYSPFLSGIRFTIERRGTQSVLKLASDKPVNEPFLDILIELNWASGRLVREYTFLLDPAANMGNPEVLSREIDSQQRQGKGVISDETRAAARASVQSKSDAADASVPSGKGDRQLVSQHEGLSAAESYTVRRGDALQKIASKVYPPGTVSLDQALTGLFQANPKAFDGGNMNRLRVGSVLELPAADVLQSISPITARKMVAAQATEWHHYRGGSALPSSNPADISGTRLNREVTGRVGEKNAADTVTRERPQPSPTVDQLRVAKTEFSGSDKKDKKISEEDLIAKDKALQEAQARLLALEKNVSDLQRLLALKDQTLADLEKKPKVPDASASQDKPLPLAPEANLEVAKTKPDTTSSKTVAAAPLLERELPKPARVMQPRAMTDILFSPTGYLSLLLVLFVTLTGYLVYRRRRRVLSYRESRLTSSVSTKTAGQQPVSAVAAAGERRPEATHTMPHTDFSQAGPGTIDTDEIDPVAEAEVYIAYGRDKQAEEILLEAKSHDPSRRAIYLKLLEIYAQRRNVQLFSELAAVLHELTEGAGPDWKVAAALGIKLDPENSLYQPPKENTPDTGQVNIEQAAVDFGKQKEANFDSFSGSSESHFLRRETSQKESLMLEEAPHKFDMSKINLDLVDPLESSGISVGKKRDTSLELLDLGADIKPAASVALGAGFVMSGTADALAVKLDLAEAYEGMGDKQGARELLEEVVKHGNADQRAAAQLVLARLSSPK